MADGHKWLLGPEGLALFYCRAERCEELALHQFGWHMTAQYDDFERRDWRPADDARRFECGSPNLLGTHALHASTGLLLEVGMDTVQKSVLGNSSYLVGSIGNNRTYELVTPSPEARRAGIVTFRPRHEDPQDLYRRLRDAGVLCAQRAGGIRFSPHFYTPRSVLDCALSLLE